MILIDKPKLKFLKAGRRITIEVPRRKLIYRVGHTYAVSASTKQANCRAEILKATERHTTWLLEIRYAPFQEPPRYIRRTGPAVPLCAGCGRGLPDDAIRCDKCGRKRPRERDDDHGYTTRASLGARRERAAVDAATQTRLTELGTLRWKQELEYREAIKAGSALHDRLHDLERAHAKGEFDASRQLAAIRRRIEALEAKRRQRAA